MKMYRFLSMSLVFCFVALQAQNQSSEEHVQMQISQEARRLVETGGIYVKNTLDSPQFYKGVFFMGGAMAAWRRMIYPAGRTNAGMIGKLGMAGFLARWVYLELCNADRYVKIGGVFSNPYKEDCHIVSTDDWVEFQHYRKKLEVNKKDILSSEREK